MSNYNLPDGYTRLLYIRCTGSQHLNTGFTVNQATDYEATVMPEGVAEFKAVFGARATTNSRRFDLMFGYGSDQAPDKEIYFGYGIGSQNYIATSSLTGEKLTFVKTANNLKVYKSGELLTTLTRSRASFTTPVNMTIGADNTNGTLSNYFVGCIFAITFNGIANYVPCKNGGGVVGLYDTISETFKTSDGDPFLAGPEVREIDYLLADSRRRMMMGYPIYIPAASYWHLADLVGQYVEIAE